MRVVGLREFVELPEGTVYAEYRPRELTGMYIKLTSKGDRPSEWDWIYANPIEDPEFNIRDTNPWDEMDKAVEDGQPFVMDMGRDGGSGADQFSEDDSLFAIYDQQDLKRLIDRLTELVPMAQP